MDWTDGSEIDFTMECDINDDGDELDCTGDNGWENYDFKWKKDE